MMSSVQREQSDDGLLSSYERWPDGRVLTKRFRSYAQSISDMTVRDTDVWVVTYPKSGTTWAQEIVWLLINNFDFETAQRVPLTQRSRFLEFPTISATALVADINQTRWMEKLEKSTEPKRLIKSHLMWSRLPKQLQKPDAKAKIIYIARNPKDVFLSYFHFLRTLGASEQIQLADNFENYFKRVLNDQVVGGPYWLHIKDFWSRRHQPNVLFLWYEDMKKDLAKEVDKMIEFLKVPCPSPDQLKNLLNHVSFQSMKKNPAVNESRPRSKEKGGEEKGVYVRQGKVGAWKEEMTPEISARFDAWIIRNTAGTDLEECYRDQIETKKF